MCKSAFVLIVLLNPQLVESSVDCGNTAPSMSVTAWRHDDPCLEVREGPHAAGSQNLYFNLSGG